MRIDQRDLHISFCTGYQGIRGTSLHHSFRIQKTNQLDQYTVQHDISVTVITKTLPFCTSLSTGRNPPRFLSMIKQKHTVLAPNWDIPVTPQLEQASSEMDGIVKTEPPVQARGSKLHLPWSPWGFLAQPAAPCFLMIFVEANQQASVVLNNEGLSKKQSAKAK